MTVVPGLICSEVSSYWTLTSQFGPGADGRRGCPGKQTGRPAWDSAASCANALARRRERRRSIRLVLTVETANIPDHHPVTPSSCMLPSAIIEMPYTIWPRRKRKLIHRPIA